MPDKKTTKAALNAKDTRETRDGKKAAKASTVGNSGKLIRPRNGDHDNL